MIKNTNSEKIFNLVLFILVFLNGLSRTALLNQNTVFNNIENYVEVPIYFVTLIIIFQKKIDTRKLLLLLIIGILLILGYLNSKMAGFLRAYLLLWAAKGFQFQRILKTCRYSLIVTYIVSVFLFISGLSVGSQRRGFLSWGFSHPNVAGQLLMLIILLWVAENRTVKLSKIIINLIIGSISIILFTDSRTSAVLLFALAICLPFLKGIILNNRLKIVSNILCYIHPLLFLITYFSAVMLYKSYLLQILDIFLTNRLFLNYFALNKWGINWFGQDTTLATVGNVYNNIRNVYWTTGATVDSAYMTALLVMGIIPSIIWSGSYVITMLRIRKYKEYILLGIAIILCFEAFTETGMIELYNNFVLFCLTANMENFWKMKNGGVHATRTNS